MRVWSLRVKFCPECGQGTGDTLTVSDASFSASAVAPSRFRDASINSTAPSYNRLPDGELEIDDRGRSPPRRGGRRLAQDDDGDALPPSRRRGWNVCVILVVLAAVIGALFATGVVTPATFSNLFGPAKTNSPSPAPSPSPSPAPGPDPGPTPDPGPDPGPSPSPGAKTH